MLEERLRREEGRKGWKKAGRGGYGENVADMAIIGLTLWNFGLGRKGAEHRYHRLGKVDRIMAKGVWFERERLFHGRNKAARQLN